MSKINQERSRILKTGSPALASSAVSKSMKEVVELFNQRYRDEDNNFLVRSALQDLGINFREDSKASGVFTESDGSISILTVRPTESKEATQELIRFFAVYLFTDVVTEKGEFSADTILHHTDEEVINEFMLLMILPVQSLDVFTPISQMIEWSIEYKIPLPVIRAVISA